ncbi:MAG TPA: hypothetical protein VF875_02295 [Anaeromyxobacter sp.]
MKRALVLVALITALPALAASKQKVAVLDVRAVQGVSPGTAEILTAIIAGDTASAGYDVLSQADIGALLGYERQKKMLGCGEDSSCLAEIGGALGAEFVMYTQVGKIGSRNHLSLQLLDARKALVLARVSLFSDSSEDALAATAQSAVQQALAAVKERNSAKAGAVAAAASPAPAAAPAATTASDESSFLSRHPIYLEARGTYGFSSIPTKEVSGGGAFDQPGFSFHGGLRWSPSWSLELGLGVQHLLKKDGSGDYYSPVMFSIETFATRTEASQTFVTLAAVWAPEANRYLSFAGALGVERDTVKHVVVLQDVTGEPDSSESVDATCPRLGLEVRGDYPIGNFAIGVRVGVSVGFSSKTGKTSLDPTSPYDTPTFWLGDGPIVTFPMSVAARYQF